MAISEAYQNTQAVGATEHSCPNDATYAAGSVITTDGVYQTFLDLSDMVLGDILRIRLYEKVGSGSTVRVCAEWILRDSQSTPNWISPTFILLHGWDWTLEALAGTITVDWSIRKVA